MCLLKKIVKNSEVINREHPTFCNPRVLGDISSLMRVVHHVKFLK